MKKALKILLISLLVVILGGAAFVYYYLELRTYDIAEDEELEKIKDSEYEIILPDTTTQERTQPVMEKESPDAQNPEADDSSSSHSTNENDPSTSSDKNHAMNQENTQQKQQGSSQEKESSPLTKVTPESIIEKYNPSFESLQSQAMGRIDSLVNRAYSEYKTKKANGESLSAGYFYQKYKAAAEGLERNTDQAFQAILNAVHQELQANGYSTSHADVLEEAYEAQKKQRENEIMSKVKDAL
ncbi:hypothetical protein [Oceanobacillus senegalensis]|uniref:hypothetical protein n=1 Tax=Oceanobacillus senegalensis TaxID=1936063 RepID=UPI000A30A107|nr:hypothetical protein [Oceanobacillus senegalensis]